MYREACVLLFVLLGITVCQQKENETLYFTTPGETDRLGVTIRLPGLYGGKINARTPAVAETLFNKGYQCAEYTSTKGANRDPERLESLDIESLSFDQLSGNLLLKVVNDEPTHLTVFKGPLCDSRLVCQNNSLEALFYNVQSSEQISPLALNNGTVFFVRTKNEQLSRSSSLRVVELRQLDGCKRDFPMDRSSMFDVEECSKLITVLAEEQYEDVSPVVPASTLIVMRGKNGMQFFVQLLYTLIDEEGSINSNLVLKQVTLDGKVKDIHSEFVARKYLMYEIKHIGGISVRDDLFCWSAFDCIYCGHWDGAKITNVNQKLGKGDASQVCKGGSSDLGNIVTGVAIVNSSRGDMYFGCIAQFSSMGGLVYLSYDAHGDPIMTRVRSNHTGSEQDVYAGSMILTDACTHNGRYRYSPAFRAVSSAVSTHQHHMLHRHSVVTQQAFLLTLTSLVINVVVVLIMQL